MGIRENECEGLRETQNIQWAEVGRGKFRQKEEHVYHGWWGGELTVLLFLGNERSGFFYLARFIRLDCGLCTAIGLMARETILNVMTNHFTSVSCRSH